MKDYFVQCRRIFSGRPYIFVGLLLLVALTGCSTKSNDNSWALVGTWIGVFQPTPTYSAPVTANFSADGVWDWTFQMKQGVTRTSGSFSISTDGSKLALTNEATGEKTTHKFQVTEKTLTIEDVPFAGTLILKKQR